MSKFPRLRELALRPWTIGVVSLLAGLGYGAYGAANSSGATRFYYMTPIAVPFVAFTIERLENLLALKLWPLLLDALVVALALSRVFYPVPFISGHVLFLTYALLTVRQRVSRIFAALVLLQTLVLKVFFWHDLRTPLGGIVLGVLGALAYRRYQQ
jgi:ABC-type Co2+ transport system permease subunit